MKRQNSIFTILLVMVMALSHNMQADEILMTGAKKGQWTMDYDAALKLAKKNDMPVFLKFTGSDWCKWCILMEDNVFTKGEWKKYAGEKIVMVTLDFPRNSTLPEMVSQRNNQLAAAMGVQGYPTYVILDSDGKTKLGQLGAGQDKTPNSFIDEINDVLKYSSSSIKSFANNLSRDNKENYLQYFSDMKMIENERDIWSKTVTSWTPDNIATFEGYNDRLKQISISIRDIEIEKYASDLDKNQAFEYRVLNSKVKAVQAELDAWLGTRPQRTPENSKIFQEYQKQLQDYASAISNYEK